MAKCSRNASPGGDPWQVLRSMHPESGLGRENRQFVARFAHHASKTSWLWQDMRAMHPKSPANRRRRTHRAKILPGRGPFRCTGTSNHARRADLAVRRSAKPPERPQPRCRRTARAARARSPGPRNTARRQRPRRLLGGKYRQQLPRYRHCSLPTPASSLRPANNSVIADSASCRDSIHAAPAPPIRRAVLAQRRATFPACGACLLCSWQMRSAYKRQAEPLLRDYFVMVA